MLRNKYSYISIFGILLIYITIRLLNVSYGQTDPLKVTTWDALGYYLYLPAILIYHDYKKLDWYPAIEKQYHLQGTGKFYQANKISNGNFVGKYLMGVAILELPFFLTAHWLAAPLGYPNDGFSLPYQVSVSIGALVYTFLALLLLRKVLLHFFDDSTTALTLLLITLVTNLPQYVCIDSAMSHAYIFPLYAVILYLSMRWNENPSHAFAFLIGITIGLATIARPTEAIMFFIPLLWISGSGETSSISLCKLIDRKPDIILAISGIFAGILPQLFYWKSVTDGWVFDVGSKWDFLNPHWQVLIGWEKGWFIFTPVALFMTAGLFFMKKYPFRKSVLTFCLLNIWIVIAWHDWRYGASYSCRALVQSYPVFALALAAIIVRIMASRLRYLFIILSICLMMTNFFQIVLYNKGILQ